MVISRRVQKALTWPLREVLHVSVEGDAIVLRPITLPGDAPAVPAKARREKAA
ncbi:MAG TPA: hypothetical protein VE779_08135 [Candidatus Angelobacter sp.]|nr:hypothetical protein [Candidatus Angelobacter sp.]